MILRRVEKDQGGEKRSSFSYFLTGKNRYDGEDDKNRKVSTSISERRKVSISYEQDRSLSQVNCRNELRSAAVRKNVSEDKSKRRIIKSYKDVKEETNLKIYQTIQYQSKKYKEEGNNSQAYNRVFKQVYKDEWNDYLNLLGIPDLNTFQNTMHMTDVRKEKVLASRKRKNDWISRNNDRVVIEVCSRNDSIRKEMEKYSEQYTNKYKF